jgi:SAM-dependent methyltransferase
LAAFLSVRFSFMPDISQHNREIHENRAAWERKPALRRIYRGFYEEIAAALPGGARGLTVELGSGMGNIKEVLPDCITTDLFPNPWLDRVENAYALSFAAQSVANLILFDVWHHLQYPGAALREFRRVLAPGGVVVLFEPAMGGLGRAIYGAFHHEPLGLGKSIAWEIPENFDAAAQTYYAAQGNCWRLARHVMTQPAAARPAALAGWEMTRVRYFPALAYLMSGGFRGPQLFPDFAQPTIRIVEKVLAPVPALTAARMLVVLRLRE